MFRFLKKYFVYLFILLSVMCFSVVNVYAEEVLNYFYETNPLAPVGGAVSPVANIICYDKDNNDIFTLYEYFSLENNKKLYNVYSLDYNSSLKPRYISVDNTPYSFYSEPMDSGLSYIFGNTIASGKYVVTDTSKQDPYVERFITQVAIWLYYRSTDVDSSSYMSDDDFEAIKSVTKISYYDSNGSLVSVDFGEHTLYDSYIEGLVSTARYKGITISDHGPESARYDIKSTIAGDSFVKSSDGKYFQSELVTVDILDDVTHPSYVINLSGIDGLRAVDTNGNVLDLNNVSSGTNFYIQVPIDKVTYSVQRISVSVSVSTPFYNSKVYATPDSNDGKDYERLLAYTGIEYQSSSDSFAIDIVGVPNTGANKGLLLLSFGFLCVLSGFIIFYQAKNMNMMNKA